MEKGNVKLSNEVDVNFSRQKTTRKNGKIVTNDKFNFSFSFKLLFGIALVFSISLVAYVAGDFRPQNDNSASNPNESVKNVTFDSSHNNYGESITDNSTNYIYPNNSTVTIDKSINKVNPNFNNKSQTDSQHAKPEPTRPSINTPQTSQRTEKQTSLNAPAPSRPEPPMQDIPQDQGKVIDFKLNDYLKKVKAYALLGRRTADLEQSVDTCIARQNIWYQQTLTLLKEFQNYLQSNYDANYFIVRDSNIEQITTDKIANSEQCRSMFDSQGSILVSLSQTIRIKLNNSLPNS